MIQRDFVQRMIKQLAEVTAKLLHLPLDGARKVLAEASEQYCELPLHEVQALPLDTLVDELTTTHRLDWTRIEFLGYLLAKDGDYLTEAGMPVDARAAYQRAHTCLNFADTESGLYEAGRVAELDRIGRLLQQ